MAQFATHRPTFDDALRALCSGETRWAGKHHRPALIEIVRGEIDRRLSAWGWSRSELARHLGVSPTIVSRVFAGKSSATGVWRGIRALLEQIEQAGGPPSRLVDRQAS